MHPPQACQVLMFNPFYMHSMQGYQFNPMQHESTVYPPMWHMPPSTPQFIMYPSFQVNNTLTVAQSTAAQHHMSRSIHQWLICHIHSPLPWAHKKRTCKKFCMETTMNRSPMLIQQVINKSNHPGYQVISSNSNTHPSKLDTEKSYNKNSLNKAQSSDNDGNARAQQCVKGKIFYNIQKQKESQLLLNAR